MNPQGPEQRWGWELLVKRNDWDAVDQWWQDEIIINPEKREGLAELLSTLRELVPTVPIQNGVEEYKRHIRTDDPAEMWHDGILHLRGAALILDLGELEAVVEGPPATSLSRWNEHQSLIKKHLTELAKKPEATTGAEELSRKSHAHIAIEMLENIGTTTNWMTGQLNDEHEKSWLREIIAEVANLAFEAGRHTQAAWGKESEKLAASRKKQLMGLGTFNPSRTDHNSKRARTADKRKAHARLIETHRPTTLLTNSDRARSILKHWYKVGEPDGRPSPPARRTLENWISRKEI